MKPRALAQGGCEGRAASESTRLLSDDLHIFANTVAIFTCSRAKGGNAVSFPRSMGPIVEPCAENILLKREGLTDPLPPVRASAQNPRSSSYSLFPEPNLPIDERSLDPGIAASEYEFLGEAERLSPNHPGQTKLDGIQNHGSRSSSRPSVSEVGTPPRPPPVPLECWV